VYVGVCFTVIWRNVGNTINGERFATLRPVEGEKPALTATQAESKSFGTIVLDFQSCVISKLVKELLIARTCFVSGLQ